VSDTPWTRRKFLAAGAGLVAGAACSSGGSKTPAPAENAAPKVTTKGSSFGQFDHLVVLMMENRSFDNMLGYLYQPNEVPRGQHFDGVAGKNLSNPGPDGPVPVSPASIMDDPNPDPGEEYPHLNTAFFGTVIPAANANKAVADMQAPFNAPSTILHPAPMNGFVQDYVNKFTWSQGRAPTKAEYSIIMNCFPPDAVPVISTLAKGFAVADHWFCDVPSQTFANRSFFHAATSSGFTSDLPITQFPVHNDAMTVFEQLDRQGVPWRIYFDRQDGLSLTYLIHFPRLWSKLASYVRFMEDFLADAANGTLPAYSLIEPRLVFNHNDEHPPTPYFGKLHQSSVLAGEFLIADVYNAIRTSASPKGSNAGNTALLITYDEGGGCYDHVSPPAAPPPNPHPSTTAGEEGFRFDRLGQRVPAVLASAYTESGTVVNAPMWHTSVMRTMSQKWGFPPLTARDTAAPTLAPFFNRKAPRPVTDWPTVQPRPFPLAPDDPSQPLNELQRSFIGAMGVAVGQADAAASVKTIGDARAFLATPKVPQQPR
jgi:phospholipase C